MSELRLTVDHLRLNYNGAFDAKELLKMITAFTKERGFDMKVDKEFDIRTVDGTNLEWQIFPWKKLSDYLHNWIRVRVLVHNYNKVDAIHDGKKVKVGKGKLTIYFDGYIELDYYQKWEGIPFFQFLRGLYNHFIYKAYTEQFEQRLTYDVYQLFHATETFLNMYKHYRVVSRAPPLTSTSQ